jgi:hypothetical protein
LSIRATTPNSKICLITNDVLDEKTASAFDNIIEIPWDDDAKNSQWKIENRWKIYHACPYENTIVLDTDMLVLEDITRWWNYLQDRDLFFTSKVLTYRGDNVTSVAYRKAFNVHNLPNIYSGFHYFKKTDETKYFFKWLEIVMNNWELFYGQFAGGKYFQKTPSIDVSAAIVTKILGLEEKITNNRIDYPTFVHMKTHCQDWTPLSERWQDAVGVYLNNDLELKIGNYRQQGIFHYTENDFLTDNIIKIYETYLGIADD